jgi:hypothetical protein
LSKNGKCLWRKILVFRKKSVGHLSYLAKQKVIVIFG